MGIIILFKKPTLPQLLKSCSVRAGIQRFASLNANSRLESGNKIENRSKRKRKSRWLKALPGSRMAYGPCGAGTSGQLGLKVHTRAAAWDRLAFCEGLLQSATESRSLMLGFVCRHFSFCPRNISSRVWSETSMSFHSQVSPITQE